MFCTLSTVDSVFWTNRTSPFLEGSTEGTNGDVSTVLPLDVDDEDDSGIADADADDARIIGNFL